MVYKFVKWDISPLENLKGSFPYQLHEKLERGEKLSREEKDRAFSALSGSSYGGTGIPLGGWMFSLAGHLKRYWVKAPYYLQEVYAFDKTSIRKSVGKCEIVEVN